MSFNGQLLATGGVAECLTDSVQVFGADGTYSSNKLLYQFENNVTNTVGLPSATNSGATFSSSTVKLGSYSAEFAGTTQHIQTNYSANDTSLTHSFWMYQQSISGSYNGILGNYWNGGSGVYGYYLWCDDPGTALNWRVHTSNSGFVEVTGTISFNTWYHVVVTWADGVGAAIYIDGTLAQFTASSLSRQQNSQEIALGNIDARGISSVGYDGFLDQYRYYNRAVSASEAQTLYAETNATTSNTNLFNEGAATALYTLDYDASDAGGLYDGAPTDVTFGVEGKINYGARLNGSSSLITITDGGIGNNSTARVSFSVSLWIKTTASNQSAIISDFGTNYGFYIQMESSASGGAGKLSIANYYTGGLVYTTAGTAAINDGNWHNLVLVNNTSDNTQKLYIDGNTTPVISQSLGSGTKTANPLQVGYYTGYVGTYNFDGSIDQIRFLQTALNTSQIQTLNAETACNYTCTTDTVNYPDTTNLAYYKLDNSADDETGVYDGASTDVLYAFGRFNQAAVFNGSSSRISLPSGSFQNTILSVSAWINVSNTSSTRTIIETYGYSGSSKGWLFRLISGKLQFDGYNGDPASTVLTSNESIPVNTWTHVAVVFSANTTGKLYINGSEAAYATQTVGTVGYISNEAVNIGALQGTGVSSQDYFIGLIDQMRIFSSALSGSQITELYNEKPCADTSTFAATLYDGNGGNNYISNVGFQPDLVWVKDRNQGIRHLLTDSVRGTASQIFSNETLAAQNYLEFSSFDENGFTVDYNSGSQYFNNTNYDYVSWNWKAGGEAVQNTQGTNITSQVSANTAAGFSIVKWAGDSNSSSSVGHGLTVNSENMLVFIKDLDSSSSDWMVITNNLWTTPQQRFLKLNTTAAIATSGANIYNVDNTTFKNSYRNTSGNDYIAYCWHSVAGYSKIGTYAGNSSTNKITLDFAPSWVMIKLYDVAGGNWFIYDNKRNPTNPADLQLEADTANQDTDHGTAYELNFLSDGFELQGAGGAVNFSGRNYLYMAFK
jgi:hypothetical protein